MSPVAALLIFSTVCVTAINLVVSELPRDTLCEWQLISRSVTSAVFLEWDWMSFISMLTNGKELAAVCSPVLITIDFNMTLNTTLECLEFCFKQISTKWQKNTLSLTGPITDKKRRNYIFRKEFKSNFRTIQFFSTDTLFWPVRVLDGLSEIHTKMIRHFLTD